MGFLINRNWNIYEITIFDTILISEISKNYSYILSILSCISTFHHEIGKNFSNSAYSDPIFFDFVTTFVVPIFKISIFPIFFALELELVITSKKKFEFFSKVLITIRYVVYGAIHFSLIGFYLNNLQEGTLIQQ